MKHLLRHAAVLSLVAAVSWSLVSAAGDAKVTKLADKNDGEKVKLAKGATLEIRLKSNLTTGFSWTIAKNDKDTLKSKGDPVYEKPEKQLPGAGGAQVFTFTAEAKGVSELELQYKRPFEKDKPAARTFKVTVTVE